MRPQLAPRFATAVATAAVALAACDRAAPPEPAARDARTSRAAPGTDARVAAAPGLAPRPVGGIAPVANMPAGTACPPYSFANNINYAVNPSFEVGGPTQSWPPGPVPAPAAATGWYMHTSNNAAPIMTTLVPTTAPAPAGARMLAVRAGSNEGGVYQLLNTPPKVMFSVWVFVNAGKVVIGANGMVNQTPYAWSTKIGEWEQLRICTTGSHPTGMFFVYNQDPKGGSFYLDKVEIRALP